MRKDVKAGLVLALAVVVVAGWYYSGKKNTEQAVPLAERGASSKTKKTIPASKQTASNKKKASKRTGKKIASNGAKRSSTRKPPAAKPTRSGRPSARSGAGQDQLASSKQTNGTPNRQGRMRGDATKPSDAKKKKAAGKGLDDVSSALAGIGKPNAQAIPPSDQKSAPPKDGKKADAKRKPASKKSLGAAGDKSKIVAGKRGTNKGNKNSPANVKKDSSKKAKNKIDAKKPNMAGSERYIIQPGDSFMLLAEVYYGSQSHAGFLMRANPQVKDPKRLRVGTEIRIPKLPSKTVKRQRTGSGLLVDGKSSGKTYTVQPGDSLTGIAEEVLGSTGRWKELYELNKDIIKNPDILRAGIVLVLPE